MASGVRLLAGREYSVLELTNKLCRRFSSDVVDAVVGELVGQSVLDDVRYGEAFCRSRVERGYGPSYIARELEQNGLNTDLVDTLLQPYEDQWFERALTQARKAHRPRSRPSTLDAMGCDEGFADDLNADEAFESSADLEPGEEWKDRQKARGRLARRLARRGFSAGLASKVIDQVLAEAESDFG
jgi:SOS response regulatory protein OraA/RecX